MDTSSRFTSPRLRVVKRENGIREGLTPREYAQLLFDEIEELEKPIFDLLFRGSETGVRVDWGKHTISYAALGMPSADFIGISSSTSPLIFDRGFGNDEYGHHDLPRNHLWGLLMVRREDRQLLWVKARQIEHSVEITDLTPELLAELFETRTNESGLDSNVMHGLVVYGDLVNMVVHKANYYNVLANKLLVKATKMGETLSALGRPTRGY